MRGSRGWGSGCNEEGSRQSVIGGLTTNHKFPITCHRFMKILIANLGSTSLKWRLFDFSNGQERLVHKGGFERVADYPKAIDDCLLQLKDARHIQSESDLAAVGFKTIMARGANGCVLLDESVVKAMEAFNC